MFKLHDNQICYNDRPLGPASCLLADYNELVGLTEADGVRHLTMPKRIDLVFAAGRKVVAVESKQQGDLVSSHANRRLARQIRTMLQEADVACLLWRGMGSELAYLTNQLVVDLVSWQTLGVVILPGPVADSRVPATLGSYKRLLAGGASPLASIVRWDTATEGGRDRRRASQAAPGWFLRYIKGVGSVTAGRLHGRFGSTGAALAATDDEWLAAGANRGILARRKEAMD